MSEARASFRYLPVDTRGIVLDSPVMSEAMLTWLASRDHMALLGAANSPAGPAIDIFESGLAARPEFTSASEGDQDVARLALWIVSAWAGKNSAGCWNERCARRICELIDRVHAFRPELVEQAGAWNLPFLKRQSTGALAHELLFADVRIEQSWLRPATWNALLRQAGAELRFDDASQPPHSMMAPVYSMSLFNATNWMKNSPDFMAELTRNFRVESFVSVCAVSHEQITLLGGAFVTSNQHADSARETLHAASLALPAPAPCLVDPSKPNDAIAILAGAWVRAMRLQRECHDIGAVARDVARAVGLDPDEAVIQLGACIVSTYEGDGGGIALRQVIENRGLAEKPSIVALMRSLADAGVRPESESRYSAAGPNPTFLAGIEQKLGAPAAKLLGAFSVERAMAAAIASAGAAAAPASVSPRVRARV